MPRVVVTGGTSGIGLGIVRRLVADGHATHILARSSHERWAQIAPELSEKTVLHSVDITDFEQAAGAVASAAERMGGLDVLINNAGVMQFAAAQDVTPEGVHGQLAVNLEAPILLTAAALKIMSAQETGGQIINIASVAAAKPTPKLSTYAATKAGLVHFTRSVAAECAGKRIRANAICPGAIETALAPRPLFAMIRKGIPLGELQTAEQVAGLVAWLLSDEARLVTGAVISLDGGMGL